MLCLQQAEVEPLKASHQQAATSAKEPAHSEAADHKGDSSPELNVEQGFLTAANSPEKGQHAQTAGQASSENAAVNSSKHARDGTQPLQAAVKHALASGKGEQPSNRYTEDRKRREAAAAKAQPKHAEEGQSQAAGRSSNRNVQTSGISCNIYLHPVHSTCPHNRLA